MFGMISNEIFWHESSLKMLRAAKVSLKAFALNPYLDYGGRTRKIFLWVFLHMFQSVPTILRDER